MMRIGIVRVPVGERVVPVPVGMARSRGDLVGVRVPVMFVAHMLVLMFQGFMRVLMSMLLGEVHPYAPSHQHRGHDQLPCDGLAKQPNGQQRAANGAVEK